MHTFHTVQWNSSVVIEITPYMIRREEDPLTEVNPPLPLSPSPLLPSPSFILHFRYGHSLDSNVFLVLSKEITTSKSRLINDVSDCLLLSSINISSDKSSLFISSWDLFNRTGLFYVGIGVRSLSSSFGNDGDFVTYPSTPSGWKER